MAGQGVQEITDSNFKTDVLGSDKPVLVDFWAPWCGPCRKIAPMIDELASENLGAAVVGKVNRQWRREAQAMMNDELVKLGLLKDEDLKKPYEPDEPPCRKYFMHGLGHPLGLDVHDVGSPHATFAPGWVITVEPGIYIPDEGFGVRLENDVLITENGPVDLMAEIPVEADEIEALMAKRKAK